MSVFFQDAKGGKDIVIDGMTVGAIRRGTGSKVDVSIGSYNRTFDGMDKALEMAQVAAEMRQASAKRLAKQARRAAAE